MSINTPVRKAGRETFNEPVRRYSMREKMEEIAK
jgi:hypothetical protein